MPDCEPLFKSGKCRNAKDRSFLNGDRKNTNKFTKDDLGGMFVNAAASVEWKKVFLLWLVFILMNTEIFIEKCISRFDGAVIDGTVAMKGTFLLSLTLVFAYIFIDLLYG
jgi:hypothetical protein